MIQHPNQAAFDEYTHLPLHADYVVAQKALNFIPPGPSRDAAMRRIMAMGAELKATPEHRQLYGDAERQLPASPANEQGSETRITELESRIIQLLSGLADAIERGKEARRMYDEALSRIADLDAELAALRAENDRLKALVEWTPIDQSVSASPFL